ncbi:hypothetical protein FA15DRAFT_670237 [Coprinopsis marcescibilis]|uniref:Cyclin N-terminal domain-containing protein n=1 Tax=Coprinopsis marcescibilis TaxID=230819 RepID=A0A5C3KSQ6_COPMA|nr:hypothetical protein FA15DRAFT_670237 [Coprinopsis marcescibilis]
MHNFTHTLAHRAPPVSRSRGRWQPYCALQPASSFSSSSSSSSARSSPAPYLNTPATSVSQSPAHRTPACDPELSRNIPAAASQSKDSCGNKAKFALSLVDQSVKTLCDIWRPQDIPAVFNTQYSPHDFIGTSKLHLQHNLAATATLPAFASTSKTQIPTTPILVQPGNDDSRSPMVPIKGFVHEVLRRSRTSGGVLQTALCYLEAIRPKLPEILERERQGLGSSEPIPTSSIEPATEADLKRDAELAQLEYQCCRSQETTPDDCQMATVKVVDDPSSVSAASSPISVPDAPVPEGAPPKKPTPPLEPLPPLPSPLLCPRRAFLAALILASKFTQDKCYSNRAWAKLSGLPPREIGRCERALGAALEWRLWVGKAPVPPTVAPTTRPVARTQSEPSLFAAASRTSEPPVGESSTRVLKRASTLPSDAFADFIQPTHSVNNSPLTDVPGLSYSPSSTESSSTGDRTIQMTVFFDDNMAPPTDSTQVWPWTESDVSFDGTNSSPVAKINGKLLTGNGLSGFQEKSTTLWTTSASFGSVESLLPPSSYQHNHVYVVDPPSAHSAFG